MLGIWGAHLVPKEGGITLMIQVLSVPVLIGLGAYNLSKAGKHANPDLETPTPSGKHGFWLGAGLNILNPVLIPFWAFASHWLVLNNFISDDAQPMILFAVGVFLGTFLLLFVVATIAHVKRATMNPRSLALVSKIIGVLFIAMAGYQGYQLAVQWLANPG
jgi:threonine/homoserine/homoserine lactone efflux protein